LTSASASKSATTTKGTAENITKLTEDIIHIHSGMTSACLRQTSRTIKSLVTVLIVFCFFVWVLKTSYASAATLNFSSADLSPGFLSG
jgi:glycogen synthase